jgi:hypothetical protein
MEVWLAIRTDLNRGTGTQKDPYNGKFFDEVMAAQPPATLIHLGPGTFRTFVGKDWCIRPQWVIEGAGTYQTTVQLGGNAAGVRQASCLFNRSWIQTVDNVAVRDLTGDSNWAEISTTADTGAGGEKNIKTGAVALAGNNNLIERIRSINSYGSWANEQEQFAILHLSPANVIVSNNLIRFCRVELPQGNYGSPYALFGQSKSSVRNCQAFGINNGLNGGWNTGGVNLAAVHNCEATDNLFVDCMGAAYHDTDVIDGFLLSGNTVIRGWNGFLNNSPNHDRNIQILHNYFDLQNRFVYPACGIGNVGPGTLDNLLAQGNTIIRNSAPGRGYNEVDGISIRGAYTNVQLFDNIVQDTVNNLAATAQRRGNRDAHGNVVPGLEDNLPATT